MGIYFILDKVLSLFHSFWCYNNIFNRFNCFFKWKLKNQILTLLSAIFMALSLKKTKTLKQHIPSLLPSRTSKLKRFYTYIYWKQTPKIIYQKVQSATHSKNTTHSCQRCLFCKYKKTLIGPTTSSRQIVI